MIIQTLKGVIALFVVYAVGLVNCGILPGPVIVRSPSVQSAFVRTNRNGGNFAYSIVEGRAYPSVYPIAQRLSYTVAQPLSQTVFSHQPFFTQHFPTTISGAIAQNPIFQYPIYQPIGVSPIFGTNPLVPSAPAYPIASPGAPQAPVAPAADLSPTPVQGNVVDEDTISVESA